MVSEDPSEHDGRHQSQGGNHELVNNDIYETSSSDSFQTLPFKKIRISSADPKDEEDKEAEDGSGQSEGEQGQDDSCIICLEPWTNTGKHRICSLKCGHLFGKICIEKWIANTSGKSTGTSGGPVGKCPQCNAPARRADVRVLFARRLVVVDTSERDRILLQLENERTAKRLAQQNEATAAFQKSLLQSRIDALEKELLQFKRHPILTGHCGDGIVESVNLRTDYRHQAFPQFKFVRSIKVPPSVTYRCLSFDRHYGAFIASRSGGNSRDEPAHGIIKVSSLLERSGVEYVGLHTKPVRSIACSPSGDGHILTGSMDGMLKMSTMQSGSVLLEYDLKIPIWCVAFDSVAQDTFSPARSNRIWAGLSNGTVAEFDIRKINSPVLTINVAGSRPSPVHSLYPAISTAHKDHFLLMGATINEPFLIELNNSVNLLNPETRDYHDTGNTMTIDNTSVLNSIDGTSNARLHTNGNMWPIDLGANNAAYPNQLLSCASQSYDPSTRTVFHSYRTMPPSQPSLHCIDRISETGKITRLSQFHTVPGSALLTKNTHGTIRAGNGWRQLGYIVGHEATSTMQVFSSSATVEPIHPQKLYGHGQTMEQLPADSTATVEHEELAFNLNPPALEYSLPTSAGTPVLDVSIGQRPNCEDWLVAGLTEQSLCIYSSTGQAS